MDNFVDELGHDMTEATCTDAAACKRDGCDYTEGEALGHEYGDWVVVKEATTMEKGEKTQTCSVCGDVISEELPLLEIPVVKGCKGSVSGSIFGLIGLCLGAIVIRRKRD
jgi:hypothetical protein